MKRQGNHRLNPTQIHFDNAVIISHFSRIDLMICRSAAMYFIKISHLFIGPPDGSQASGFCCHDIDAITKINCQIVNTRPYEFHDFVFYKAVFEYRTNNGQCHILRSYAAFWYTVKINRNNARVLNIIRFFKQLLYQFSATFANSHRS
jgi:hypothetical protein